MEQRQMPELWMIESPHWSLPITVEWKEDQRDTAAVRMGAQGVPMTSTQVLALREALNRIGTFREGRWWILTITLKSTATRIGLLHECDVEDHLRWTPLKRVKEYESYVNAVVGKRRLIQSITGMSNEFRMKNRADFFIEYSKRCGLWHSPETIETVWVSFTRHCLDWLLNDQRPVDLGFALVVPSPYHARWKEIFLKVRGAKNEKGKSYSHSAETTYTKLLDPSMVAWSKEEGIMLWNLEIIPTDAFRYNAKIAERLRAKVRGPQYVDGVIDTLKRLFKQTVAAYASWYKKATAKEMGFSLSVIVKRAESLQKKSRVSDVVASLGRKNLLPCHAKLRKGKPRGVAAEDAVLPTVPNLRPVASNVRNSRRDVGAPGDGNSSTGVPVLDAVQEPAGPVKVLGERSGGDGDRLGKGT